MFYREIRFIGNLQTVTNIMIQDKIYIFTTEYQIKDGCTLGLIMVLIYWTTVRNVMDHLLQHAEEWKFNWDVIDVLVLL